MYKNYTLTGLNKKIYLQFHMHVFNIDYYY